MDVRQDQRYLAEKDLFLCGERDESRFSQDFEVPLSILGREVLGTSEPSRDISISRFSTVASNGLKAREGCPRRSPGVREVHDRVEA